MVTTFVPVGVFFAVVSVRVVLPDPPLTLVGLNDAFTRCGRPLTLKLTVPVKPFTGVIVTVNVPAVPFGIVVLVGFAAMVKFGVRFAFTTSVTVV